MNSNKARRLISSMLAVAVSIQISGCINNSTSTNLPSAQELPAGHIKAGDSFHGYVTLSGGWEVYIDPRYVSECGENHCLGSENQNENVYRPEGLTYSLPNETAVINIKVFTVSSIEEELYSQRQVQRIIKSSSSPDLLTEWEERVIELEDSQIFPVYRFSCSTHVTDTYLAIKGTYYSYVVLYSTTYLFVGFDKLARRISVCAQTETLLAQTTAIIEETYTFDCLPSGQSIINISRSEKTVLVDLFDVKVTLLGYYETDEHDTLISLLFENNRKNDIIIHGSELRVNGIPLPSESFNRFWLIPAGDGLIWRCYLGSDLSTCKVDYASDIGFSFHVYESNSGQLDALLLIVETHDLTLNQIR